LLDLLESIDNLNHLRSRIEFIMNSLTQSSNWIDEKAAEGLYYTLSTVEADMTDVRDAVDSARMTAFP